MSQGQTSFQGAQQAGKASLTYDRRCARSTAGRTSTSTSGPARSLDATIRRHFRRHKLTPMSA